MKDGILKSMPIGTPGFDFVICDSGIPILACFDTGSYYSCFDETTASEIDIKKYKMLYDENGFPVYDIPITHPAIGSIVAKFLDPDEHAAFDGDSSKVSTPI